MKQALNGIPVSDFEKPADEGWVSAQVCSESHLLPTEYCPNVVTMRFRAGKQPATQCTLHVPKEVAVPDVRGLPLEQAQTTLTQAHFLVETTEDQQSAKPAGTVTAENPRTGTLLMQGETVTLSVSNGAALRDVPDLVGLDITTARTKLDAAGLLSDETLAPDPSAPGTVLSQDPAAGTPVPADTAVKLVISGGPEEMLR